MEKMTFLSSGMQNLLRGYKPLNIRGRAGCLIKLILNRKSRFQDCCRAPAGAFFQR
jgi:hypothetical protein